jgi:Rrf2 family protein
MQLTRTADYGVRVMVHLAAKPVGARINATDLAQATGTSPAFLAKILQQLVTARLIVSQRGYSGGFSLARPAAAISLLDVVAALDGGLCLNRCLPGGAGCDRADACSVYPVWQEAQTALAGVLSTASIESLAKQQKH